jgi:hypothetical protein
MTAPVLHCKKAPLVAGQDQVFDFFYLLPAVQEDGTVVQIRQPVGAETLAQLNSQLATVQARIALTASAN